MRAKNFFVLITSALLLSASLFLAPAAFAQADVCENALPGSTKVDSSTGSVELDATHETTHASNHEIWWSGTTFNYDLPDGGSLQVCIKAGADASEGGTAVTTVTGSGTLTTVEDTDDDIDLNGLGISHISYIYTFVAPTTATASIGEVPCGQLATTLTLSSSDSSDFSATVTAKGGTDALITKSYTGVSSSTPSLDLSSLDDGEYTVTVSSTDLSSDVTKDIAIERDCEPTASGVQQCVNEAPQVAVTITPNEYDGNYDVALGTSSVASNSTSLTYNVPVTPGQPFSITVAKTGQTAFETITGTGFTDCAGADEPLVDEEEPVVLDEVTEKEDPVAPTVEEEEEVEVLPQVIERDELSATGDFEDRLLVIALALMGLGLPMTLAKPKWQRINER
ncbi:MAG: hypothetical protein R3320_02195 [Nitriliruptorales bacterium]|nr:hypothetical protein [Nitriliruptorales bacterium]